MWGNLYLFLVRIVCIASTGALAAFSLCVFGQDFLFFPNLVFKLIPVDLKEKEYIPPHVGHLYVDSEGTKIEFRKVRAATKPAKGTILFLHGSKGTVDDYYPYLKTFSDGGYVAYAMEYRGYGSTGGWPSVNKIVRDSDAAITFIAERDSVPADSIIPVGFGLGASFAAHVAATYDSKNLVLISPFTTLKEVTITDPYVNKFSWLFWNNISTKTSIERLKGTCVVSLQSKNDKVVPVQHSEVLKASYEGKSKYVMINDESSTHESVFSNSQDKLITAIDECNFRDTSAENSSGDTFKF